MQICHLQHPKLINNINQILLIILKLQSWTLRNNMKLYSNSINELQYNLIQIHLQSPQSHKTYHNQLNKWTVLLKVRLRVILADFVCHKMTKHVCSNKLHCSNNMHSGNRPNYCINSSNNNNNTNNNYQMRLIGNKQPSRLPSCYNSTQTKLHIQVVAESRAILVFKALVVVVIYNYVNLH